MRRAALASALLLAGCASEPPPPPEPKPTPAPALARELPKGESGPTVLLAQAWFTKGPDGKPVPAPARLEILRPVPWGWARSRLEDPESNVFHKAMIWKGGILTIGAERALLKHWTIAGESWTSKTLYEGSWGGQFDRLRDLEIGDVDGDGEDELVIATHDQGVVVIVEADGTATELPPEPDTFVHEVELGDVDGDGLLEIYVTPSGRNRKGVSQPGRVDRISWTEGAWARETVARSESRHAKEILVTDLGDGDALLTVWEGELGENGELTEPVAITRSRPGPQGWTQETLATVPDRQTRFLVPGDFDADGQTELIAATMSAGLYLLEPGPDGWTNKRFDVSSGGFEHACTAADLDGDGKLELVVAADRQRELNVYRWNEGRKTFDKERIGRFDDQVFTWNITAGTF